MLALLGLSSIANAIFSGLTSWITSGATSLLTALGHVIGSTTSVSTTGGFSTELAVISRIGAELCVPFFCVAVISAIAQRDLSVLLRALFIRLPLALVFSGIAVELVSLALVATDQMSATILQVAGPSVQLDFKAIAAALAPTVADPQFGLFAVALLATAIAVVAFLLWLELVIRSAAISVALLFLPLALAGIVWPSTAHWARRLAETIAALVLSKLVIAAVLALAAASIAQASGPSAVVTGVAVLLLAVLAPFSLLRLIPAVEAGAISHFEGMSRRATRAMQAGIGAASGLVASSGLDPVSSSATDVPYMQGSDLFTPVIDDLARQVRADIDRRAASTSSGPVHLDDLAGNFDDQGNDDE